MNKLTYSLLLCLLPCLSFSQITPGIVLTQITEENGLSDNHVQCVYKDSQGFVWIGTADGLNLANGSTMQVFRHAEGDTASLASNNIFSLAEDQSQNIWIATNVGVSCYQRKSAKFLRLSLPFSNYGASNIVRTVMIDRANQVWCASDGGLFLFNIQTKHWTAYYNTTPGEKPAAVNKIVSALADKKGDIWLCSFDGLWLFDSHTLHFTRAVGTANDPDYDELTTAVFEDGQDRIWFGNWSKGLKLLNRVTGAVTTFSSLPGAVSHVTAINEIKLPGGRNVICLSDSQRCFDPMSRQFLQLPKPLQLTSYPIINNFYRSTEGWMWMGSDKGLLVCNPQRQFFQHHLFSNTITSQNVNLLDWENGLLIGGEGESFLTGYDTAYRINNPFTDVQEAVSYKAARKKAPAALCFTKENSNTFLIANSGGILRYNFATRASQWFLHNSRDSTSIPTDFIQHIFIDSRNRYWVFPWRCGIYNMNPSTGAFQLVYKGFWQQQKSIKGLVVVDATEDQRGNIWMADLDEGIVLFDNATNRFSKPFGKQLGPRSRSARVICQDQFCYSFADDRLLKWNTATRDLQIIKLPLQMQSNIYDLALDNAGNCWIATKKGLLLYTENTKDFKQFTTTDGLLDNDMDGTLYARHNGNIVYASPTALTQFNPQDLLQSFVATPNVFLTGIEAGGENIHYESTQTVQLNYTQNNLVFRWAITDYTSPFRNRYWCRLQDIDADWKYVGNKGEMQYANLSPGTYNLLLKAATANGIISNKIISVHFEIHPPFWKAAWFRAIWIALSVFAIYWFVTRYIKAIKTKAAIAQQITELELKALKAQMNPHFIFNSLSSIQESIMSGNNEAASKYLGKFSKLIRAVLENSDSKLITLSQELDYLKVYLELESFRFDDFHFLLDAAGIEDAAFLRFPPMLVQPYLENAIKHGLSGKEGAKNLSVVFKLVGKDLLQVVIADDGIGRKQSAFVNESRIASHQSMGMKITEERLNLQNSKMVDRVEISDLINQRGEPAGTRVTIQITIEK